MLERANDTFVGAPKTSTKIPHVELCQQDRDLGGLGRIEEREHVAPASRDLNSRKHEDTDGIAGRDRLSERPRPIVIGDGDDREFFGSGPGDNLRRYQRRVRHIVRRGGMYVEVCPHETCAGRLGEHGRQQRVV